MDEKRSVVVYTSLRPAEREQVDVAAEGEGISISAFVRRAVLRDLQEERHE